MTEHKMTYRPDLNVSEEGGLPDIERGQFCYEFGADYQPAWFWAWFPETNVPIHLPVCIGEKIPSAWLWSGPLETPSLHPSVFINPKGTPPGWHGWLTNGIAIDA